MERTEREEVCMGTAAAICPTSCSPLPLAPPPPSLLLLYTHTARTLCNPQQEIPLLTRGAQAGQNGGERVQESRACA